VPLDHHAARLFEAATMNNDPIDKAYEGGNGIYG